MFSISAEDSLLYFLFHGREISEEKRLGVKKDAKRVQTEACTPAKTQYMIRRQIENAYAVCKGAKHPYSLLLVKKTCIVMELRSFLSKFWGNHSTENKKCQGQISAIDKFLLWAYDR